MLAKLSDCVIPAVMFLVVGYGLLRRVKVYEAFLKGAKEGMLVVVRIVPTLIGLIVGVGVLRASGFFALPGRVLAPAAELLHLPAEVISLLAVKAFSSSAATGLLLDILATYGPDSYEGFLSGLLMSCTETIFYTMSVYFLAAGVTKTRYTIKGALLATLTGTAMSVLLALGMG